MKRVIPAVFVMAAIASSAAHAADPVAIVVGVRGSAIVNGESSPVALFRRMAPGVTITTEPDARLVLAFAGGSRFEMGEKTTATVENDSLRKVKGSLRQLASVAPLPRIQPLAAATTPAGAIRIRGTRIESLYPSGSATAIASATTLRFAPVSRAAKYQIEVEDENGAVVHSATVNEPLLRLPDNALQPARRYYWRVRTLDLQGGQARGEAEFSTISAADAGALEALRKSMSSETDAASLALLAEANHSLGLIAEASELLGRAAALAPEDQALKTARAHWQR